MESKIHLILYSNARSQPRENPGLIQISPISNNPIKVLKLAPTEFCQLAITHEGLLIINTNHQQTNKEIWQLKEEIYQLCQYYDDVPFKFNHRIAMLTTQHDLENIRTPKAQQKLNLFLRTRI